MYAISALVRRTFFQDKPSRQRYLAITGGARSTHTLNKLSRQIERGEFNRALKFALLAADVPVTEIAQALEDTCLQKSRAEFARFVPRLTANFNVVLLEARQLHVFYIQVGHMTQLSLPHGIERQTWDVQLTLVCQQISAHRELFYSEEMRSARKNYFGDIDSYRYEPTCHLSFSFSPQGELLQ